MSLAIGYASTLIGGPQSLSRAEKLAEQMKAREAGAAGFQTLADVQAQNAAAATNNTAAQAQQGAAVTGTRLPGGLQAAALYQAQEIAQTEKVSLQDPDPATRFLDFQKKSPEERLREAILKEMGLSEEQLAAMPASARAKVEEEIAQKVQEHLETKAEHSETGKPAELARQEDPTRF